MKKKFFKTSLILLIIGIVMAIITYFMFHYLTDTGFVSVKRDTAGKPFVTNMAGIFSTMCVFGSLVFLLKGLIIYKDN